MGILARILGRAPVERRWGDGDGWGAVAQGMMGGGHRLRGAVSAERAQGLAVLTGCVELISSAMSVLPASLVIDTPDGRQPAPSTAPEQRLIQRPNARMGLPGVIALAASEILLFGNSVWRLDGDGRGAVIGLTPVPWPMISPGIIGHDGASSLVFDLTAGTPEGRLLGLPPRLLASEVMHLKGRSDFGIIGRSVLSRGSPALLEALQVGELASSTWGNGMRPSGVLTSPTYLTEVQRKRKDEFIGNFSGAINAGKVPLLENGWTYQKLSMSSVDAEFLATRKYIVEEICRLFSVPSVLLQLGERVPADLSPYTAAFASQALAPLVAIFEAEFDHAVLPPGMHLQLDMSGLLRGSYSAAVAALCAATQSGITTPNDARRSLGLAPLPDGDTLRTSSAPSWPATFKGGDHLGANPGPTGDGGLPVPGTHEHGGDGG